jgi:hypothetical protein
VGEWADILKILSSAIPITVAIWQWYQASKSKKRVKDLEKKKKKLEKIVGK